MTLAFLGIGGGELVLIVLIALAVFWGIGNYGKDTALGYRGSVLLSMVLTPLVAFAIIRIIKSRSKS